MSKAFKLPKVFFSFILLTHKGSHIGRSTKNSYPVMTSSAGPVLKGLIRPLVPCTPSWLHYAIANSASTGAIGNGRSNLADFKV